MPSIEDLKDDEKVIKDIIDEIVSKREKASNAKKKKKVKKNSKREKLQNDLDSSKQKLSLSVQYAIDQEGDLDAVAKNSEVLISYKDAASEWSSHNYDSNVEVASFHEDAYSVIRLRIKQAEDTIDSIIETYRSLYAQRQL